MNGIKRLEKELGAKIEAKNYLLGNGNDVYFVRFDNSNEYFENYSYVYNFAKRHKLYFESHYRTCSFELEPLNDRKTRLEKGKKVDFLCRFFEAMYHVTKDGDRSKKAQERFVVKNPEYKEAFDAIYN